jgi:arabinofuranosyltransferase
MVTMDKIKAERAFLVGLLILYVAMLFRTAWLNDDAYIAFRTVDNFVSGHGLTWNATERVQSFTCPLWVGLMSVAYLVTGDVYYTSIALQVVLSVLALVVLSRTLAITPLHAIAGTAVLLLSKAFIDFSTSGLENPLTHLIVVLFLVVFFKVGSTRRSLLLASLLFSLALLTRLDIVLLLAPAMVVLVLEHFGSRANRPAWRRDVIAILVGLVPLILWESFSIVYYGFPFPNTAYAKLGTGIDPREYMAQGIYYLFNSIGLDPITLVMTSVGIALASMSRNAKKTAVALGAGLTILYVVRIGGDFMSGRFLTAPLLASVVLVVRTRTDSARWYAASMASLAFVLALAASFPTLSNEYTRLNPSVVDLKGVADHRRQSFKSTGLLGSSRSGRRPEHEWVERGERFRRDGARVVEAGGTGFTGFYAGPDVYIVDMWSLSDPLRARLPWEQPPGEKTWRIGHIYREMPAGYRESLEAGRNLLDDDELAEYYDKLLVITRGRIASLDRIVVIIRMNLGCYNHLLESYNARMHAGTS